MNPPPKPADDLARLVGAASDYVRSREGGLPAQAPPLGRRRNLLAWLALAGGLAWGGYALYGQLAPPRPATVAKDLDKVIAQAQALVERTRERTGALPDTLPSSALASVVQYQREGGGYRLTAAVMGVRVTLEPGGQKTTQTGVQP